nr:hypothetical protein [Tanacetum cinerariifolium]
MFPILSRMAMDIISVQASSIASESAFSTNFEEDVFDDEVQRNEAISLSDEEIALDASSEGTMSSAGPRKTIYMGHRRSLLGNHPYRIKKELFNGTIECGVLRPPLDGESMFSRVRDMNIVLGKEKNVYESLIGLLLYIGGKTKDRVNVRNDMEDMGIRPELTAKVILEKRGDRSRGMCGPHSLRNMYPFERYMGYLKGYVRNRSRPEGSIVKGYAAEEVIEFGTNYLRDVRNVGIPQSRHKGRLGGVGTLGRKEEPMHQNDLHEAHFTVLQHMTSIAPYIYEHQSLLKNKNSQRDNIWLTKKHNQTYTHWLKEKARSTLPNMYKPVEELGFGPEHDQPMEQDEPMEQDQPLEQDEPMEQDESLLPQWKKRGPNKMKSKPVEPFDVKFNKFGEAINDHRCWFANHIGNITRLRISITYETWRHVPEE